MRKEDALREIELIKIKLEALEKLVKYNMVDDEVVHKPMLWDDGTYTDNKITFNNKKL